MSTTILNELTAQAQLARQLQVCNACRYCEGFCAVFPAMTRRLSFSQADSHYLANLCHNCGACLHACQYAPPHEFGINIPQATAQVRLQTYTLYAWPAPLGRLYQRNGLTLSLALGLALALFLLLALARQGTLWHTPLAGNFYAVFPHQLLVWLFGSAFAGSVLALGMGLRRFWRAQRATLAGGPDSAPMAAQLVADAGAQAGRDALSLRYLGGGHGQGCNDEDDRFTLRRRFFHHLTFYGFALCFAATSVATLYHYLFGWPAPYAYTSLPVLLGSAGGIGLLVGPAGLFWLKQKRHPQHGDAAQNAMDYGFIALLFFMSLTGMALLVWRNSPAMALLLAIHLGFVMAFFLTMPYSKFAHGFYRLAALFKWALEKRLPNPVQVGSD